MVAKSWEEHQKDSGSEPESQRKAHSQGSRPARSGATGPPPLRNLLWPPAVSEVVSEVLCYP